MPQSEKFEVLVLGSGTGGKLVAWYMAQSGHKTAVVERRWLGGSCPNIACMPSKNEISSAKVAHVARQGVDYGTVTDSVTVDMATVRRRKREMVERQVATHLQIYLARSRCTPSGEQVGRGAGAGIFGIRPRSTYFSDIIVHCRVSAFLTTKAHRRKKLLSAKAVIALAQT
jgi:choline dehydrogenase-like flavoprotein